MEIFIWKKKSGMGLGVRKTPRPACSRSIRIIHGFEREPVRRPARVKSMRRVTHPSRGDRVEKYINTSTKEGRGGHHGRGGRGSKRRKETRGKKETRDQHMCRGARHEDIAVHPIQSRAPTTTKAQHSSVTATQAASEAQDGRGARKASGRSPDAAIGREPRNPVRLGVAYVVCMTESHSQRLPGTLAAPDRQSSREPAP